MNQQKYLDEQESFLRGIENSILEKIRPTMNLAIAALEKLEDATDADYAAALEPLNNELAGLIASQMFNVQRTIAEGAQQFAGGTIPRMKSPAELMESATIQGESIASNFKKEESNG